MGIESGMDESVSAVAVDDIATAADSSIAVSADISAPLTTTYVGGRGGRRGWGGSQRGRSGAMSINKKPFSHLVGTSPLFTLLKRKSRGMPHISAATDGTTQQDMFRFL